MIGGFMYTYIKYNENQKKTRDQNFNEKLTLCEEKHIKNSSERNRRPSESMAHCVNELRNS